MPQARGVLVCMAGQVHAGAEVRKIHPYRLDAFDSGDAGPLGYIEEGFLRRLRDWPQGHPRGMAGLESDDWPRVDIVMNHVGADGQVVDALRAAGTRGFVAACTGNGTLSTSLESALLRAQEDGIAVLRAGRVGRGCLIDGASRRLPSAGALTPVQARVELLLRLL
jgi:L-asparaginase